MSAALEPPDDCPVYSEQLWDGWKSLFDLLVDNPAHSAAGRIAADGAGRWQESTNFDADVLVGVGFRLADRAVAEVVPLDAVLALVLAGVDMGVVRGPSDVPFLGVARYVVEDATYLTLVGDPGRFGHLAWSDTPDPPQWVRGMVENVLDWKDTGEAVGQQMEEAAFQRVTRPALNRMGQAKKTIRHAYNSGKENPGGLHSSDGEDEIQSVTRTAIADGEWPGSEWVIIEIPADGPPRYLAGLVYDRANHRWRPLMTGRGDRDLSQAAFNSTKPGHDEAQEWKATFDGSDSLGALDPISGALSPDVDEPPLADYRLFKPPRPPRDGELRPRRRTVEWNDPVGERVANLAGLQDELALAIEALAGEEEVADWIGDDEGVADRVRRARLTADETSVMLGMVQKIRQTQIADELGIDQPKVSKLWSRATRKIREAGAALEPDSPVVRVKRQTQVIAGNRHHPTDADLCRHDMAVGTCALCPDAA